MILCDTGHTQQPLCPLTFPGAREQLHANGRRGGGGTGAVGFLGGGAEDSGEAHAVGGLGRGVLLGGVGEDGFGGGAGAAFEPYGGGARAGGPPTRTPGEEAFRAG